MLAKDSYMKSPRMYRPYLMFDKGADEDLSPPWESSQKSLNTITVCDWTEVLPHIASGENPYIDFDCLWGAMETALGNVSLAPFHGSDH
jgi:hypothetical protein